MNSKKITLALLSFLAIHCSNGQTKDSLIRNIRGWYTAINQDKSMKKIDLDEEEFLENTSDGGGELTGYFRKDSLVKMVSRIGISYGNSIQEFYFHNDELFFAYVRFESFIVGDTALEMDRRKPQLSFEGRYYFKGGRLIEKRVKGKIPLDDDADPVRSLLADAADFGSVLKKSYKKGQH